jgi:acyl-CoA thioester hydrolase
LISEDMLNSITEPVYRYEFTVPVEALDVNGHVNNVTFVQWMQAAAVRHYSFLGGVEPMQAAGASWVVRSHQVEYLRPAFAGDIIETQTWVANLRRVRSVRRYRFIRKSDRKLLVKGETE